MYAESKYNIWKHENDTYQCVNVLHKSLVELTNEEHSSLFRYLNGENSNPSPEFNEMLSALESQGIVLDEERDEFLELRHEYYKRYYDTSVLDLTLVSTFLCNFQCPYCFESEKQLTMDKSAVSRLLKFADKVFPSKKAITVGLFGGEPLLNFNVYR